MRQRRNNELIHLVATRLRELREERGLSQLVVWEDTDIDMHKVEGEIYNITLSTIADLCDYYNITLKDFFKTMPNP